jgi:hypothetical protein
MSAPAPDPAYVAARRILLDALIALEAHRSAVIVAGAQAIYLQTGEADLDGTIAPYTTDGDLAVNPSLLGDDPQLEAAMRDANFELMPQPGGHIEPGIWVASTIVGNRPFDVPVDLIVPDALAGNVGRRGVRLGIHGKRAARRAVGLEAALVDHASMTIVSLEDDDTRSITADVAGVPALFVAKAHKLHDRIESQRIDRLSDKDAADVFRLMQASSPREIGHRLAQLAEDPVAGGVTRLAVIYLATLFGRRGRPGVEMATRALRIALPAERVEAIAVAYTRELTESYEATSDLP